MISGGPRQAGRAAFGVGQIDVAVLGAEKARPAGDVGIADEHIGRHAVAGGAALVGDDRADRRIDDRAAGRPAGVHAVDGRGVLVDDVMMHGADEDEAVEHLGALRPDARRPARRRSPCRSPGNTSPAFWPCGSPSCLGSHVSICPAPPPSQTKMQCSALPSWWLGRLRRHARRLPAAKHGDRSGRRQKRRRKSLGDLAVRIHPVYERTLLTESTQTPGC